MFTSKYDFEGGTDSARPSKTMTNIWCSGERATGANEIAQIASRETLACATDKNPRAQTQKTTSLSSRDGMLVQAHLRILVSRQSEWMERFDKGRCLLAQGARGAAATPNRQRGNFMRSELTHRPLFAELKEPSSNYGCSFFIFVKSSRSNPHVAGNRPNSHQTFSIGIQPAASFRIHTIAHTTISRPHKKRVSEMAMVPRNQ